MLQIAIEASIRIFLFGDQNISTIESASALKDRKIQIRIICRSVPHK